MTSITANASSANQLLTVVLNLMAELKALYRNEVEAMRRNDTQTFMALQPDKLSLTRDYELRVKEIQARASSIKEGDTALREKIIAEQSELAILADLSQNAALRMAEAVRRLQERLMIAARESIAQEKIQYTQKGAMHGANIGKPIATAINEAI